MSEFGDGNVERRLRAAVESAPSGLLMVDGEGRIVLVNREIERLFGYPREELLGRSVDQLVPERFRGAHAGFRAGFTADPRVRAMGAGRDLYGLRKDGREVPVEIGLTPVATAEGMFVLGSIVDITARKRAEELFRAAVESSPSGMILVDGGSRIVLVNREVERLFGYERQELLGQSIEILVPDRARDLHPGYRKSFMEAPTARSMGAGRDLRGRHKDGSEVPLEIGLNPLETEDGTFVLASVVDISTRKEAEATQRRLEAELRQSQKMEALGTLAGGVAHDFNNILGAILGYSELLENAALDEDMRRDATDITAAALRGRQLVARILAFSRRQETLRRPMALGRTVEEAGRLLRATLPSTIALQMRGTDDLPRVLADATAVHQIIMNLGTNAAHAMRHGGELEISIEPTYLTDSRARAKPALTEGSYVVVSVRDTGEGMPPEVVQRAFEPFFTTKPVGSGSGLGLAMVHGLMREHGGTVEIESTVGVGTLVRCWFPTGEPDAAQVAAEAQGAPSGRGERVLFVDDEPALARLGERRLGPIGYEVDCFTDSRAALTAFRANPEAYDLVVSDLTMPGLTGLDLARAITAIRPLPFVLMTGRGEGLTPDVLAEAGVDSVYLKPLTLDEMATMVRSALDGAGRGSGDPEQP